MGQQAWIDGGARSDLGTCSPYGVAIACSLGPAAGFKERAHLTKPGQEPGDLSLDDLALFTPIFCDQKLDDNCCVQTYKA